MTFSSPPVTSSTLDDAAAVSYRDYGDPCELKPGCIVVYQWPNKDHHVDFCDVIIDVDTVRGLGGNQGSQLQDSDYSRRIICRDAVAGVLGQPMRPAKPTRTCRR